MLLICWIDDWLPVSLCLAAIGIKVAIQNRTSSTTTTRYISCWKFIYFKKIFKKIHTCTHTHSLICIHKSVWWTNYTPMVIHIFCLCVCDQLACEVHTLLFGGVYKNCVCVCVVRVHTKFLGKVSRSRNSSTASHAPSHSHHSVYTSIYELCEWYSKKEAKPQTARTDYAKFREEADMEEYVIQIP